jgi:putative methyltransferase (TIGR04325 family)
MGKLLGDASSVVDLGGNVGVTYHGFRRYLLYPQELRWTVVDLPAVIAEGRSVASSRPSAGLRFAASLREVERSEIFLASGSLQFIAGTMAEHLAQLRERPSHLILNKLPLHDGATAVTLQNTGDSFAPCWLYNARELISSIEGLGYELVDRWSCADRSLYVPFDDRNVPAFSGLYFRERSRQ